MYRSINKMALTPHPFNSAGAEDSMKGGKRRGVPVKTLKKLLKKAGLKTSGKKAALTRRAKKAKLMMKGGTEGDVVLSSEPTKASCEEEGKDFDEVQKKCIERPVNMGGRKGKSRGKKGMGMGVYY
jgi:hypothetical protein